MRLVCQPASRGNLAKRVTRRQHHLLRTFYARIAYVCMRRYAEGPFERVAEISRAQFDRTRQLGRSERAIQILLNLLLKTTDLPRQQATAHEIVGRE